MSTRERAVDTNCKFDRIRRTFFGKDTLAALEFYADRRMRTHTPRNAEAECPGCGATGGDLVEAVWKTEHEERRLLGWSAVTIFAGATVHNVEKTTIKYPTYHYVCAGCFPKLKSRVLLAKLLGGGLMALGIGAAVLGGVMSGKGGNDAGGGILGLGIVLLIVGLAVMMFMGIPKWFKYMSGGVFTLKSVQRV